jgi:hypothetical protein
MLFMVKAFDSQGFEYEFENTAIGEETDITFKTKKAAEAFIEGIKLSAPNTLQYKIIPVKEGEQKCCLSKPG